MSEQTIENSSKPIIRLEHITKSFKIKKNTVHALKDISITVNKGDIYGIIGMSGAGKSTLVRCINFLEQPTSGEVFINDIALSKLSNKELLKVRAQIGMIFQGFNLLMQRTVLDNVCFPLEIAKVPKKKEAKEKALELLKMVGLEEKANSYPAQLSGGQQQRVAIARALTTNPPILLCDEATSALDPQSVSSILDILHDINKKLGITIVLITHQMSVVKKICNKVAILEKGELAEAGFVKDLFATPKNLTSQKIIYGEEIQNFISYKERGFIKLIFDEVQVEEHLIADMILKFNAPVSIMYANTNEFDGITNGYMVLDLPKEPQIREKLIDHLLKQGLRVENL